MVLVTGASGFVGSAVLKYLIGKGRRASGTVRESSSMKRLSGMQAHLRNADLRSFDELVRSMEGCRAVVHCAARSLDWGYRRDFYETNVLGVRNLVRAAVQTKEVERIVYISTANVAGYGRLNMDERQVHEGGRFFTYSKTKLEGENTVRSLCREMGIANVVLRPSAVYGPDDWKWSYEMIHRLATGSWPLVDGGKALFTPVYIGNLCRAVELAIESEKNGLVLNITDDRTVSWREFSSKIAHELGVSLKLRSVPSFFALGVAALVQSMHVFFSPEKPPNLTLYRVIRSSRHFHYSCERAKNELSYRPDTDIDSHIRRTVDWYRSVSPVQPWTGH
jgi:nucleoside-diphosphate-sugar epimerase